MSSKRIAWLLFFTLIAMELMLLGFTLYLYRSNYSVFINQILQSLQRPDLYPVLAARYFPPSRFETLKVVLVAASIVGLSTILILYYLRKKFIPFLIEILHIPRVAIRLFSVQWKQCHPITRWISALVFILILCRTLWYDTHFYLQYDELWNANLFLSKPWYYSIAAYNNYPLHNIVSQFFISLFGNHPFILRLPSLVTGLLLFFLLFHAILYFIKNEWVAVSGVLVFACWPLVVFYMMYARGVLLEVTFSLLVLWYTFCMLKKEIRTSHLFVLALLQAGGTASMLSHFYFVVAHSMFMGFYFLFSTAQSWKKPVVYILFLAAFHVLFFTPMLLGTGITPGLAAVSSAQTLSLSTILAAYHDLSDFLVGNPFGLWMATGLIAYNMFRIQNPRGLILCLLFSLFPFFIAFTSHIFPPPRALGFMIWLPMLALIILLQWSFKQLKWATLVFTGIMVFFF
ncbi:MAG TPA: glycosyltransferase family 39 protein, partial [Chitinophagaceae bacterium]|nr:glycosyltransferase family 39 protein [Chitinophagaceae bacterium]